MIFRKKSEPEPRPEAVTMSAATGLPVLPDDFRWAVRKKQLIRYSYGIDHYVNGYEAAILNKRKRVVATSTFEQLNERNIRDAARRSFRTFEQQRKREDAEARLLGEYPPKRLEAK